MLPEIPPVTSGLRKWYEDTYQDAAKQRFFELCTDVDTLHQGLEAENGKLWERLLSYEKGER